MIDYIVVQEDDLNVFIRIVKIKMSEGYKLVGGVSYDRHEYYIQALTKES
jgi:hypothetical protein